MPKHVFTSYYRRETVAGTCKSGHCYKICNLESQSPCDVAAEYCDSAERRCLPVKKVGERCTDAVNVSGISVTRALAAPETSRSVDSARLTKSVRRNSVWTAPVPGRISHQENNAGRIGSVFQDGVPGRAYVSKLTSQTDIANGEQCSEDWACRSSHCVKSVCVERVNGWPGSVCNTAQDCIDTLDCVNEECRKHSCQEDTDCNYKPGLICYQGRFDESPACHVKEGNLGSPCTEQSECVSSLECRRSRCSRMACTLPGGNCRFNSDCCSGSCVSDGGAGGPIAWVLVGGSCQWN